MPQSGREETEELADINTENANQEVEVVAPDVGSTQAVEDTNQNDEDSEGSNNDEDSEGSNNDESDSFVEGESSANPTDVPISYNDIPMIENSKIH